MDFAAETVDAVLAYLRADRAKGLSAIEAANRVRAVSYTHLDVYKRQVHGRRISLR